ncbi:MAG: HmuY family protein [Proteiniphilum sp.]|uniref:HmuY family protein n=1 Tax=Proteiniphilum sp. TaxID=1926877 RepID=UPI002B206995|nr:HmuY family protein [Proteiniphilum sp.]MEA5128712.1 HmuY family protein [Proteiniphilum sp.]
MKKKMFFTPVLLSMVLGIGLGSCGDDDPVQKPDLNEVEFTTSRKTDYGDDWIYFSFSQGKEVAVTEDSHTTNLTWDLAFNRYNIRTNSGKSGNGQGGAYPVGKVSLSSVVEAPTSGYVVDTDFEISDVGGGLPPPTKMSTANPELCKAIGFTGPPPAYTPNEVVYVVKTADGKYAKVLFTSFYDVTGNSGFITFKYVYQPDGSTDLK